MEMVDYDAKSASNLPYIDHVETIEEVPAWRELV